MEPGRNRRTKRLPIHLLTTLYDGDARQSCTIVDVSRLGARIALTAPVLQGDQVRLVDDRVGALDVTVRWCRNGIAGVAFHRVEPESPSACAA